MTNSMPTLPSIDAGNCVRDEGNQGYRGELAITFDSDDQYKLTVHMIERLGIEEALNKALNEKRKSDLPVHSVLSVDSPLGLYVWIPGDIAESTARRRLMTFVKLYSEAVITVDDTLMMIAWRRLNPRNAEDVAALHEQQFKLTYADTLHAGKA